jgi:hypothetical protein
MRRKYVSVEHAEIWSVRAWSWVPKTIWIATSDDASPASDSDITVAEEWTAEVLGGERSASTAPKAKTS